MGKKNGAGGGGGSSGTNIAIENLVMFITSGGVTTPIGTPQDTLQAWITTKPWDLGHADKPKFLDRIITHLTNRTFQTNMTLEIYGSDEENGTTVLLQELSLASRDPVTPDVQGFKYFQLRFIDRGVKERWILHGFEIFGELGGDEF